MPQAERDRSGCCIAQLVNVHHDFVHAYTYPLGNSTEDPLIGLVRDDERNIVTAQVVLLHDFFDYFGHSANGYLEHCPAVLV